MTCLAQRAISRLYIYFHKDIGLFYGAARKDLKVAKLLRPAKRQFSVPGACQCVSFIWHFFFCFKRIGPGNDYLQVFFFIKISQINFSCFVDQISLYDRWIWSLARLPEG